MHLLLPVLALFSIGVMLLATEVLSRYFMPVWKYVIEVIVIAECRCAPDYAARISFADPLYWQAPNAQQKIERMRSCYRIFGYYNARTGYCILRCLYLHNWSATCGLSKIDSSPIKTKMSCQRQQCCEATVEIYGVECACQSAHK